MDRRAFMVFRRADFAVLRVGMADEGVEVDVEVILWWGTMTSARSKLSAVSPKLGIKI